MIEPRTPSDDAPPHVHSEDCSEDLSKPTVTLKTMGEDIDVDLTDTERVRDVVLNGQSVVHMKRIHDCASQLEHIVEAQRALTKGLSDYKSQAEQRVNWFKWAVRAGCVASLVVVSLVLDHLRHLPDKVANGALGGAISDLAAEVVRKETAGHGHSPIYTTGQLVSWKESGNDNKDTHGRRGTVVYFKVCQGDPDHRYLYKVRMWPIPKQDKGSALVWVKEGYLYAGADAAIAYAGEDLVQEQVQE